MDLREFLAGLSVDPIALSGSIKDPKGTIEKAKLDEIGRRVLHSRSPTAMWNLLLGRDNGAIEDVPMPAEIREALDGKRGMLAVVGTGIRTVGQMTVEALAWIRAADVVPY